MLNRKRKFHVIISIYLHSNEELIRKIKLLFAIRFEETGEYSQMISYLFWDFDDILGLEECRVSMKNVLA